MMQNPFKTLRESRGLVLSEFATLLECSTSTLGALEQGVPKLPSDTTLARIREALGWDENKSEELRRAYIAWRRARREELMARIER